MTNLDQLKERLPDHARDQRINLNILASSTVLSPAQAGLIAIACANTTKHRAVIDAMESDADPAVLAAGRGAAVVMAMNNVYYRFVHFMTADDDYARLPARLRMQIIGNPGVPKLDFELACLAASAITGCENCVRAHEKSVRDAGGSKEMVHDAVRIAAVVNATAVALPV
ncbi:MAG: carboxymuconolactone decarboxylase family protein [Kofleriaceae bacterium]